MRIKKQKKKRNFMKKKYRFLPKTNNTLNS